MKKLYALIALLALIAPAIASAAISDSLVAWYNGTDNTDAANSYDLTGFTAGITTSNCIISPCWLSSTNISSASQNYVNITDMNGATAWTVNFWSRTTNTGADQGEVYQWQGAAIAFRNGYIGTAGYAAGFELNANSLYYQPGAGPDVAVKGALNMWTYMRNSTGRFIMVNGTVVASSATTSNLGNGNFFFMHNGAGGDDLQGTIDEIAIWNRALNQTELDCLYNSGSGVTYDTLNSTCSSTPSNYFEITATDLYDASSITTFYANVTINGTTAEYGTTNGTINFNFTSGSSDVNATVCATNYFCQEYLNHDTTSNLAAELFQAQITFTADEIYTGTSVTDFTVTTQDGINANDTNPVLYLKAGSYTISFNKTGWYDRDFPITVSAYDNTTQNLSGVYAYLLNVTFYNAFTNATISTYTANLTGTYSVSESTTNGSVYIPYISDTDVFILADAIGYAYANTTVNVTASLTNASIYGYSNNSILIYVYDENTQNLLTGISVNATVSGDIGDLTNTTTNGTLYFDFLPDGNYSVKVNAANYTQRSYFVTVADRSTQILNVYLTTGSTSIFTFVDQNTGNTLPGVVTSMDRSFSGTWVTIQSVESGPDGRSQFVYEEGVRYRFTNVLNGYQTNLFYLDPILFSTYTVQMTASATSSNEEGGVGVTFTPKTFFDQILNNLTFIITSPEGLLENYSLTVDYPGGTNNTNGTNSYGGTDLITFVPNAGNWLGTVNITIDYTTTTGGEFTNTYTYALQGGSTNQTFYNAASDDYGLSDFEKIFIATTITLFIWGGLTLAAGSSIGAFIGIAAMGLFAAIGFVPFLAWLISALAAFSLLSWRSTT